MEQQIAVTIVPQSRGVLLSPCIDCGVDYNQKHSAKISSCNPPKHQVRARVQHMGLRGGNESLGLTQWYNQQSTLPFSFGSSKSLGQPISSPVQNVHPAQRLDIRDPP